MFPQKENLNKLGFPNNLKVKSPKVSRCFRLASVGYRSNANDAEELPFSIVGLQRR